MIGKNHIKEHTLIKGLRNGNRRSQKALYELYKVRFFGLCRRYTKSKQDAEDQLQEAFIKIFKDIKGYKSQGSFEGWMRRIVVNTCLMHIRKEKKLNLSEELPDIPDRINNRNRPKSKGSGYHCTYSVPAFDASNRFQPKSYGRL